MVLIAPYSKLHLASPMFTWPIMSGYPQKSKLWPQNVWGSICQ